jgi:hypothetical protein
MLLLIFWLPKLSSFARQIWPILCLRHRHERRVRVVPVVKPIDDTLKSRAVSGSRVVQLKPQAGGTPTQEWKLRIACMLCVYRSCRGEYTTGALLLPSGTRERTRETDRRANTKRNNIRRLQKDKALLEAACRIIKPGELENLTLDKTAGCVLEACP